MQPMHRCSDCGLFHGGADGGYAPEPQTPPEVEIARINAERDITIARLGAKAAAVETETVTEAATEVAEVEAAAAVAVAEVMPEPAPVEPVAELPGIVDGPPADDGFAMEDEDIAPAPEQDMEPAGPPAKKSWSWM